MVTCRLHRQHHATHINGNLFPVSGHRWNHISPAFRQTEGCGCCWYSADNSTDPQSSSVTQQQAAWWSPPGGRFGLGRGIRRRLACGGRPRENERCYHQSRVRVQSAPSIVSPLSRTGAAAGCLQVSRCTGNKKEKKKALQKKTGAL